MRDSTGRGSRQVGGYVLCYTLYALLIVLSLLVFAIWRLTVLELIGSFIGRSYANRLLYQLGVLALGFGAFILVMAAEPYLRTGVERRQLARRFARLAIPLAIVGALGLLLQLVLVQQP